jgi:hypothetical protein
MAPRYPGAKFIQSPRTAGELRDDTLGVVIHWTAGHEPGNVAVLSEEDPRSVNVQFYCPRDADPGVYQFTETDERANHGFETANRHMVGIECEGSGEPWTRAQYDNIVALTTWLCDLYAIPKAKCDPSGHDLSTFHGICGHRDLSLGGQRVDENDHTDTVPDGIGWEPFLKRVKGEDAAFYFEDLPWNDPTVAGAGPVIAGSAKGYAQKAARDRRVPLVEEAHPGTVVSTLRDRFTKRYFILVWNPPLTHPSNPDAWFRSQGFATEDDRDRERRKREANVGRKLSAYRGARDSRYPWPG